MSQNRDEREQFTDEVTLADVLKMFDDVEGPAVTSGDVAAATGPEASGQRGPEEPGMVGGERADGPQRRARGARRRTGERPPSRDFTSTAAGTRL
jgi:hypothetical protein